MYLETTIKLSQYIDTLQEPIRFFVIIAIYFGLPILCILLLWLDKKIDERKIKKISNIK